MLVDSSQGVFHRWVRLAEQLGLLVWLDRRSAGLWWLSVLPGKTRWVGSGWIGVCLALYFYEGVWGWGRFDCFLHRWLSSRHAWCLPLTCEVLVVGLAPSNSCDHLIQTFLRAKFWSIFHGRLLVKVVKLNGLLDHAVLVVSVAWLSLSCPVADCCGSLLDYTDSLSWLLRWQPWLSCAFVENSTAHLLLMQPVKHGLLLVALQLSYQILLLSAFRHFLYLFILLDQEFM